MVVIYRWNVNTLDCGAFVEDGEGESGEGDSGHFIGGLSVVSYIVQLLRVAVMKSSGWMDDEWN